MDHPAKQMGRGISTHFRREAILMAGLFGVFLLLAMVLGLVAPFILEILGK
jgi:putative Mn2+ efflux pump MntP